MTINEIHSDKKRFLPLLLLADEQENMIDRYLDNSRMFVLTDDDMTIGECVVQDLGNGLIEVKNIAIDAEHRHKGYGRILIDHIETTYRHSHSLMQVGTGDSRLTVPFYEKCGFRRTHVLKNFFVDNYDHPIFEDGTQLIDMIYLQKEL